MKLYCDDIVYFAKTHPDGVIPSKRVEDGCYDLYSCFEEDYLVIMPHETKFIPTGIASAFSDKWMLLLQERGSKGSKGMALRCGVIDSGYRDEIFIALTNVNNVPVVIVKEGVDEKWLKAEVLKLPVSSRVIFYPYRKAICQGALVEVPKVEIREIPYDDLKKISSERGLGKLGSSNK